MASHLRTQSPDDLFHLPLMSRMESSVRFKGGLKVNRFVESDFRHINACQARTGGRAFGQGQRHAVRTFSTCWRRAFVAIGATLRGDAARVSDSWLRTPCSAIACLKFSQSPNCCPTSSLDGAGSVIPLSVKNRVRLELFRWARVSALVIHSNGAFGPAELGSCAPGWGRSG